MFASLTLLALAFDAAWGYPAWLFRAVGHPVSWMGRLIAWCETAWNGPDRAPSRRRHLGSLMLIVCLAATLAVSTVVVLLIDRLLPFPFGLVLLGPIAGTLIAQRSLYHHVRNVAAALEDGGLAEGRRAVSRIVGRDTASLDEAGVARAAIESLAENFSDAVVGPVFWLLFAGLPGAALYKAINTADSMVGHKSERYGDFGWASAHIDDLVNVPASRLAALWLSAAAALLPEASGGEALRAVARDARRHRSPNAGWPEAAMAGALGLSLAGPRLYEGTLVADAWMGQGRSEAGFGDIRRALRVYRAACLVQAGVIALLAVLLSL